VLRGEMQNVQQEMAKLRLEKGGLLPPASVNSTSRIVAVHNEGRHF
jgi:hypothetical protein